MKTYGTIYKKWIRFLIKRKLYGAWINDVCNIMKYLNTSFWTNNNIFRNFNFFFFKSSFKLNLLMGTNSEQEFSTFFRQLIYLKKSAEYSGFLLSTVMWGKVYENFENRNRPTLSLGLSRKLNRASKKKKIAKEWGEIELREKLEQPWYNKSYVKNNRNLWRK